jgi:hypothetical protein
VLISRAKGANASSGLGGFFFGEVCGSSATFSGYNNPTVKQIISAKLIVRHFELQQTQNMFRQDLDFSKNFHAFNILVCYTTNTNVILNIFCISV